MDGIRWMGWSFGAYNCKYLTTNDFFLVRIGGIFINFIIIYVMQAIVVHNIRSISLSQTLVDNRMKAESHLFQIYHPHPFTKCNNFDKYM